MKHVFMAAVSVAASLGLLCGCAGERPDSEKRTLDEVLPGSKNEILHYDTSDNFELTNHIVTMFNQTSKTTQVSAKYFANDAYDDMLRTCLYANEGIPDTMYLRQPGQANQYAENGWLAGLSEYVAASQIDVANYGTTLELVNLNGKLFSLPRVKSVWLLFYNKTLFDKYEIEYPGQLTWDQYANLAQRLTKASSERGKIWGGHIPLWTMNLGASSASEYLTDDELPVTRKYIQLLNKLYNIDESHPPVTMMEEQDSRPYELFEGGQLAMMINGDWSIGLLENAARISKNDIDWNIAPLPVFDFVEADNAVGGCSYMAISAKSAKPQSAFEFISYYCGGQAADICAEYAACPAYFTSESAHIYLQKAQKSGARFVFQSNILSEEGAHVLYREINNAFKKEMREYLISNHSLDDAFEQFYALRADILLKSLSSNTALS